MKKRLIIACLVLYCMTFILYPCGSGGQVSGTPAKIRADGDASYISSSKVAAKTVDLLIDVNINESEQKILIQADDTDNPILLYIHGGPGDPAMMFSHTYSDLLRNRFVFVNWDQRGAGLSWHEGMDESKITEDQLVDDALELTRFLIQSYKKDKIYIIGHSYGSIIGMRLASEHPELYHAYIGIGQVLDWNRSVSYTRKWLTAEMKKAGDVEGLKKLESSAVPDMNAVIGYGGHTHKAIDYDKIIKNSPYYFDGYIDLKNKARELVQRNIAKSRSTMSFWDIEKFRIPIYFFEGRFDHVTACAPELVIEFCDKIEAPEKETVWFEDSAHMPNLQEPVKFQQMIIEKLLK